MIYNSYSGDDSFCLKANFMILAILTSMRVCIFTCSRPLQSCHGSSKWVSTTRNYYSLRSRSNENNDNCVVAVIRFNHRFNFFSKKKTNKQTTTTTTTTTLIVSNGLFYVRTAATFLAVAFAISVLDGVVFSVVAIYFSIGFSWSYSDHFLANFYVVFLCFLCFFLGGSPMVEDFTCVKWYQCQNFQQCF